MPNTYSITQLDSAQECIDICVAMINSQSTESALRHNLSSYLRLMFPGVPRWVTEHVRGAEAQVHLPGTKVNIVDLWIAWWMLQLLSTKVIFTTPPSFAPVTSRLKSIVRAF